MKLRNSEDEGALDALLWSIVYREGPISRTQLAASGGLLPEELDGALERLLAQSRIEAREEAGATLYRSRELFIPLDAAAGWEAAVFDHFHALVSIRVLQSAGGRRAAREQQRDAFSLAL